jgi:small multidrug resistance family-3 protein
MAIESTKIKKIAITLLFFFIAGLCEIGGSYLVWLWLREKKTVALGALGGIILFGYGIIPTLQPAEFGRVYAAYGGIFIVSAITWGRIVDKKKPDRYEIIGSIVTVVGALVNFMLHAEGAFFIFRCNCFRVWK